MAVVVDSEEDGLDIGDELISDELVDEDELLMVSVSLSDPQAAKDNGKTRARAASRWREVTGKAPTGG